MKRLLVLAIMLLGLVGPAQAHLADNPFGRTVSCIPQSVWQVVDQTAAHFHQRALIISGYRNPFHNRQVHGAKHSLHMACRAMDFAIPGVSSARLVAYVRGISAGGVGQYGGSNFIHVDNGPRRFWFWGARHGKGHHRHRGHHKKHRKGHKRGPMAVAQVGILP